LLSGFEGNGCGVAGENSEFAARPKASDIVEVVIRKAGVNFATGQSVQKILGRPENEAAVGGVLLTKGEAVPCDLVVVAIGVIPARSL